jgi:arginase
MSTTHLSQLPSSHHKKIRVIGVPLDLGASRRGVDMGPSAVRVAGLEKRLEKLGHVVDDAGNVAVSIAEQKKIGDEHAKYLKEITATCTKQAELVVKSMDAGYMPLVLGGDHSIAAGTVSGVAEYFRRKNEKIGLIWLDAHGDINTPSTSPSGNVHGMPVAALLGRAGFGGRLGWTSRSIDPERLVLFGTRTLDPGERHAIRELGVRMFTMSEIDQRGVKACLDEAIERLAGLGGIHISFDIDAVDPLEAPGVGTPWPGGLTYREAHLAMEVLADTGQVSSMEVVEVNPIADHENRTGKLAAELILSALGRTIA